MSEVLVCGSGQYGQLGLGRPRCYRATFVPRGGGEDEFNLPNTALLDPTPVARHLEWENIVQVIGRASQCAHCPQVAAGSRHTLVLTDDGRVFAWGYGAFGEIGVGDKVIKFTPQRILLPKRAVPPPGEEDPKKNEERSMKGLINPNPVANQGKSPLSTRLRRKVTPVRPVGSPPCVCVCACVCVSQASSLLPAGSRAPGQ